MRDLILYISLGLLVSFIILLLLFAEIPSADDFSPDNPFYNGLSNFVYSFNVSRVATKDLSSISGEGSIVFIIGPSKNFTPDEAFAVKSFLDKGGILFIADDYGTAQDLLNKLGVEIDFYKGVLRDPIFMYRSSYLPRVSISLSTRNFSVYMNYGTALDIKDLGRGICLGYSSVFSFLEIQGVNASEKINGPLCVFYRINYGKGVIYVLSDSSIFINAMIGLGDNKRFIEEIIDSYVPYVITDKWSTSLYTETRLLFLNGLSYIMNSSYRYALASLIIFATYVSIDKLLVRSGRRVLEEEKDKLINHIINKHPDWDRRVLERLFDEVLRNRRENRS